MPRFENNIYRSRFRMTPHTYPVFRNPDLDLRFRQEGYVVTDFLSPEDTAALLAFFEQNAPDGFSGFHTTHFSTDKHYKQKVHDAIVNRLWPVAEKLLVRHVPAFGNFMVKEAGGNNPMPLHADWTYVDESTDLSLSIWIPLVDTDEHNGCLGVIPQSHLISPHIRGPRIVQSRYPCNETLIDQLGRLLPLKAGQAAIYNHQTQHYSQPNGSNKVRPAVNLSMVPKNARLVHYTVPEGATQIHKYEVDDLDFFIRYDNFQVPEKGTLVEHIPVETIPLLNERSDAFLKSRRKNGWNRLLSLFKSAG